MNLIPALASPGAGHAGRAHLWAAPAATTSRERRGLGEILRGGSGSGGRSAPSPVGARWTRERIARVASLGALLALTAMLYLVGLSASGYANEFYAAAAQAGSVDWWAFLWGSSDAGNSITVDKPPASLWVMALSIRLFGLSSWSLLVPQALMGVASVGVLYATVRRGFGHWCGLLAGALLATTPVACLMFRFDNPGALLVLLLVGSASCVLKAASLGVGEGLDADEADGVSSGAGVAAGLGHREDRAANRRRTLWMALAGALMGLAFLTKQLQAFLVLPGFAVAFLVASPTRMRRRILDSAVALGAMVVAAGWWVLLTVLVPADMRPYFGGSETNSFVELTFWYNGLGRIFGNTVGGGSMARQGILMGTGGEASLARLLTGIWATQWSWAFPAALVGTGVGLAASGRARRTDARRAQVMLWAGWLLVTFVTFSYMEGTIHQYYTVALAPAVAALSAIGARALWELRERRWARVVAACAVVASAAWATALVLGTSWLVTALLAGVWGCAVGAVGLVVAGEVLRARGRALTAAAARVCAVLAVASLLVVPVAHSVYTASQGHHGSIVTAGPSVAGSDAMGGMGGNGGLGGNGGGRDGGMGGNAAAGGPASTGGNGGPGAGMGSSADGSTSGGGPMAGAVPSAGGSFPGGSAPPRAAWAGPELAMARLPGRMRPPMARATARACLPTVRPARSPHPTAASPPSMAASPPPMADSPRLPPPTTAAVRAVPAP